MGLGQLTLEAMEEEESHLESNPTMGKCTTEVLTDIMMKMR